MNYKCALLMGAIAVAPFISASAAADTPGDCERQRSTERVELKLPDESPMARQWIISVRDGRVRFIQADARRETGGTVVGATVEKLSSGQLRGAIAIGKDGAVSSTRLKAVR